MKQADVRNREIVTAGSTYMDIDAYACCVAMKELLERKGEAVVAYSKAPCNYSVCGSLIEERQIAAELPAGVQPETSDYIIVDVSDPDYLKDAVPLERVVAVYDHHVGFEEYWRSRIGAGAHIEFIGAAATLIYREWKWAGLAERMTQSTARLLIAAILDNTLNLTSSNTTAEDVEAFRALCAHADVDESWCAAYFSEVQTGVEADLKNALLNDTKTVRDNLVLPPKVAQLCVWDAGSILRRLPEIRGWFEGNWMLNIIDMQRQCSWFVCDDASHQEKIGKLFGVSFENGAARTPVTYLRKEIIKKTLSHIGG